MSKTPARSHGGANGPPRFITVPSDLSRTPLLTLRHPEQKTEFAEILMMFVASGGIVTLPNPFTLPHATTVPSFFSASAFSAPISAATTPVKFVGGAKTFWYDQTRTSPL